MNLTYLKPAVSDESTAVLSISMADREVALFPLHCPSLLHVLRSEDAARPGQVVVHANELEYSASGQSTGNIVRCALRPILRTVPNMLKCVFSITCSGPFQTGRLAGQMQLPSALAVVL